MYTNFRDLCVPNTVASLVCNACLQYNFDSMELVTEPLRRHVYLRNVLLVFTIWKLLTTIRNIIQMKLNSSFINTQNTSRRKVHQFNYYKH